MLPAVRYRVVRKIAHGGMAEVFLAVQLGAQGFQKPVVLKRILPALAADPAFVDMLIDEAHIASTLNHSNLVHVLDLRRSRDGGYFLVLEYVDGWSLEEIRRRAYRNRMPLPLALHVTSALCRGLAYVHSHQRDGMALDIVHRDISPHNVLVSREGEVKLADFGIAKAAGRREQSASGVIKGKVSYMSPEQTRGGEVDARSDLFAVGTLLYVLATGKKPFNGESEADVLMQVRRARYDKPSTLIRDFNPDVERFIARALRADLARRWQSAGQMAERLDAILVKLAQPSGPAALKRWLEAQAASGARGDEVPPPAESTIEIGSADLELEDVAASAPKTKVARRRSPSRGPRRLTPPGTLFERPAPAPAASAPAPAPAAARATPSRSRRTWRARARRFVVKTAIAAVVLAAALGGVAHFARPYLPDEVVDLVAPVETWVRDLPARLGVGVEGDRPPPR
jgi:serine/threonine protein kinase